MSDSLQSHGLQYTWLPCPSPSPGVSSNSCPLSRWCYPTISSSAARFSCTESFPASGSFPTSQVFESGGQSIGAPVSASAISINIQGWFPFRFTSLISLLSRGLSNVFSSTIWKHQFFGAEPSLWPNSHICIWLLVWLPYIAVNIWTLVGKVMSLLFNTLSRFVIAFLRRSKHLWISWLLSPSTVIWEPKKIKSAIVSTFPPSICH